MQVHRFSLLAHGRSRITLISLNRPVECRPDAAMIEAHDRIRKPALLIVDMQNDFVRVGAALEVADARATIPANRALLERFRARSLPVVYTKFITFPAPVLLWEWSPQALPPTKCCW